MRSNAGVWNKKGHKKSEVPHSVDEIGVPSDLRAIRATKTSSRKETWFGDAMVSLYRLL